MDDVLHGCGHVRRFPRQVLERHAHPGLELIAVLAGKPRWQAGDRVESVPAGWVHFNLPWQAHGTAEGAEAPREIRWLIIKLDRDDYDLPMDFGFHPALGIPAADARRIARRIRGFSGHATPASPSLLWLMERAQQERRARPPVWQRLLAHYVAAMLYEFERCLQQTPEIDSTPVEKRVAEFLRQLKCRAAEPWTLNTMAASCGISRTRFGECCHQLTGESPVAYLRRQRVELAKALLVDRRHRITDIAFQCGFGSSQYLARVFRDTTGISPSAYREMVLRP